jgi:hypothetical protein
MQDYHPAEEDLVMLYYRECKAADRLRSHLETCDSCKAAYRNLARVLEACDDLPVPEPHPAFESRMWNRLEPQLQPLNRGVDWASFLRARWLAAVAVAAMLVLAFLAGRSTRPQSVPPKLVAISPDGRQRVLLMALGDHLERSQMVLVELANAPDQASDVPLERERARNLISENRLYRQTTEAADPAVAQVLDELERVLLDISLGTSASEIKSRIDSEGLLFKLRVLGTNLQSQQLPKETL